MAATSPPVSKAQLSIVRISSCGASAPLRFSSLYLLSPSFRLHHHRLHWPHCQHPPFRPDHHHHQDPAGWLCVLCPLQLHAWRDRRLFGMVFFFFPLVLLSFISRVLIKQTFLLYIFYLFMFIYKKNPTHNLFPPPPKLFHLRPPSTRTLASRLPASSSRATVFLCSRATTGPTTPSRLARTTISASPPTAPLTAPTLLASSFTAPPPTWLSPRPGSSTFRSSTTLTR